MPGRQSVRVLSVVGFLAAPLLLAAGSAAAQSGSVRACADQNESRASERIEGCSALIPRLNGKTAGVAYGLRGLAYLDRGDVPHAIADLDKAVTLAPDFAPAYQNRGNAWYARGNYGRAIADYDAAIRLEPNVASAYANRATVKRDLGYIDGAIDDYAKAISLDGQNPRAFSGRGELYLRQEKYDRAVSDFTQALRHEPQASTYMLLGQARERAGDFAHALTAYAEAARLDPDNVAPINAQASVYTRKGEINQALGLYERSLRLDPNAPTTYRLRAEAYAAKGDRKRALKEMDRVLKFTWTPDALRLRAQWRLDDGDLNGAMSDVGHITKLDADDPAAMAVRGAIAARKKDYSRALADLDKAVGAGGAANAFALKERGIVYAAKGDNARALSDLNRAIELGSTGAVAYRERGKIYRANGDLGKALSDFDQAIARDPATAITWFERSALRKMKGDTAGQLGDLNEALKRQPDNAMALYERGLVRNGKGDSGGALADFDAALKLEPKNAAMLKSRAAALMSRKDVDVGKAIGDLNELIAQDASARNYYQRGLLHERNKDAVKAAADYKAALGADGKMSEASKALARVTAQIQKTKPKDAAPEVKTADKKVQPAPMVLDDKPDVPLQTASVDKPAIAPLPPQRAADSQKDHKEQKHEVNSRQRDRAGFEHGFRDRRTATRTSSTRERSTQASRQPQYRTYRPQPQYRVVRPTRFTDVFTDTRRR